MVGLSAGGFSVSLGSLSKLYNTGSLSSAVPVSAPYGVPGEAGAGEDGDGTPFTSGSASPFSVRRH